MKYKIYDAQDNDIFYFNDFCEYDKFIQTHIFVYMQTYIHMYTTVKVLLRIHFAVFKWKRLGMYL